ncbi:MAG: HPr(Ser) kinase/phosphatase [Gemmatimonadetes bacterium]|nr:HPr(Ser) kinase/phosphatase [Gemmatimonadota bacterium]
MSSRGGSPGRGARSGSLSRSKRQWLRADLGSTFPVSQARGRRETWSDQDVAASLSIQDLIEARGESLSLELLTPEVSLKRDFSDSDVANSGLALAGFVDRFPAGRMQVFGETEMQYLSTLPPDVQAERLIGFFSRDIPAAFVTKGLDVPPVLIETASSQGVPLFRSALSTKDFFRRLKPYLEVVLAPSTTVHGSLADVYGVGLLFMGKSGIGKSECVLDLIERGHRLVADDVVMVSRRGNDVLIGRGHDLQRHHMEIRGIGIIDVRALFGIRAIRQQKRIEVVVQLEEWDDKRAYDRTGLDVGEMEILGVATTIVSIPLNPGKNVTVLSEVIAMNHLLKYAGVDSAAEFDRRLRTEMAQVEEYLEEDYE